MNWRTGETHNQNKKCKRAFTVARENFERGMSPSEALTYLTHINNTKEADKSSTEEITEYMKNLALTNNTDPRGEDWESRIIEDTTALADIIDTDKKGR